MRAKWIDTCALRASPRKRHACTTSDSPRRTNPDASSLPPNEAEPATIRPCLPNTPRSQSPGELSRTLTSPRAGALVLISSRPLVDGETSWKHARATAWRAVTVLAPAAAGAASASEPSSAPARMLRPCMRLDPMSNSLVCATDLEDSGNHARETRADDDAQHDRPEALGVQAPEARRADRVTADNAGQERAYATRVDHVPPLPGHDERNPGGVQDQERRGQRRAEDGGRHALRFEPECERRAVHADRGGEHARGEPGAQRVQAQRRRTVAELPERGGDDDRAHPDLKSLLRQRRKDHQADREPRHGGRQQAREPVRAHAAAFEQDENAQDAAEY